MDKFVEKFNIFDLFTMLIPGIVISLLFCIPLSFKYYDIWIGYGNEKYVIFFIFSYLCGILFQELGSILDKLILCKILYGGNPKEIFLIESYRSKIFNSILNYNDAKTIEKYFIKLLNLNESFDNDINKNISKRVFIKIKQKIFKLIHKEIDLEKEIAKVKTSYIYAYFLNIAEMNNLTNKSDKMFVISEMSRSLFWGCICTIIINFYMFFQNYINLKICIYGSFLLLFIGLIFIKRKKRYEKYRVQILVRSLFLYLKQNNLLDD